MRCRLCRRTVGSRQAKAQTKTTDTCLSVDLLFLRPDLGTGWHISDSHQIRHGFPHVFNGGDILRDVRWFLQTLSGRLRRMWLPGALGTGVGNGGQGRNRTTDTRIFSPLFVGFWLYISISYRGARCPICTTMHNNAQLIHAKLPQISSAFTLIN